MCYLETLAKGLCVCVCAQPFLFYREIIKNKLQITATYDVEIRKHKATGLIKISKYFHQEMEFYCNKVKTVVL